MRSRSNSRIRAPLRTDSGEAARLVPEHLVDGRFSSPVYTITPAIDLLNAQRKGDADTETTRFGDPAPREEAHRARVEILRARRRDLLSVGGSGR